MKKDKTNENMNDLVEIYHYREMIFSLVHRDLRGKYKGSVLGFAWTFVNPLLQLVVYTIVFSVILRSNIEDYYNYLFVALVPWIFFSTAVNGGATCIRDQSTLVTKIYFPRQVLPISHVTSQFVNMLLSMLVVIAVLLISGKPINPRAYLYFPLVAIIEYFVALGITLIVSALNVFFRDMQYIMNVVIMAWQYLTPVMYGIDQVPERLRPAFNLNPMTAVIVAYRDILYYGKAPELETLLNAIIFSIVLMIVGWKVFDHMEGRFAEVM